MWQTLSVNLILLKVRCYEWMIQTTKKAQVGDIVGLYFEPDAIHIMVPGETEAEFDKRIESYED